MVPRAAVVPLVLAALAPACPAPEDAFGGPGVLLLDDLTEPLARETTELPEFPTMGACGDGRLDPGEGCDLGDANADDGPCTSECRLASCGDGLVHAGVEACDPGAYDEAGRISCTPDCRRITCGDGLVDPGMEECDLGEANADDGSCTTQCKLASCGDGLVHAGHEQCDLGEANTDDGDCTTQCTLATCGDGLVHAGHEQCDLGRAGNGLTHGGCLPDCTLGPRCGDHVVQPGHEECDDGLNNGTGLHAPDRVPCDADCRLVARLVFVTSAAFSADLGGLDGADLRCQNAALHAGLPDHERFRAWLADDTGSPLTRFDHGDEFAEVPYALVGGLRVADDLEDLLAHGPQRGIDITETGELLAPQRPVWTNVSFTGAAFAGDAHCERWTSSAPALAPVRVGLASVGPEGVNAWKDGRLYTSWEHSACANEWRLYCFEQ